MKPAKKKSPARMSWVATGVVVVLFLCLAGGLFYLLSTDKGGGKKVFVSKIELVKPNLPDKPPPPPKEQLPEPEALKKESIVTPQSVDQPQEARNMKGDDKPAASGPLGVEGEGGAGSDAFGLAARGKGGRDITTVGTGPAGTIGGDKDMAGVMRRHAKYNKLVEDEVNKAVKQALSGNGGIPKGKLESVVQIGMDEGGAVGEYRIIRSSGNRTVDEAVRKCLDYARISEPPPKDIPRGVKGLTIMSIKIVSQG
jgi:periplasmic protein TonB